MGGFIVNQFTYSGNNDYGLNGNYLNHQDHFYQKTHRHQLVAPSCSSCASSGFSDYGLNDNYLNHQGNFYQNSYRPEGGEYFDIGQVRAVDSIVVGDQVRVNQGVRTWATGEGMPSWVHGRIYPVIEIRTRNGATQLLLGGINSWILQTDVTRV